MQQQNVPMADEAGVPSETHWFLPSGFGSIDLPPEEGGLPREVGEVRQIRNCLRPGLETYTFTATIKSPVNLSCEFLTGQPYLWLMVHFSGECEYRHGDAMHGATSTDRSYAAMLRDPLIDLRYTPSEYRSSGVVVSPARLREMLQGQRLCGPVDDFIDGCFDPLLADSRPTPTLRTIANQIFSHPYQGTMASLFLEAKAFEMVAESLRVLVDDNQPKGSVREHRYAMVARDIFLADLANPPRIEDVAKQVGLSQRRLNEVFREAFDASPLQCLVQWRLDHARDLLAAGQLTIKQVAHRVGYAHVSNFSLAFTRRFGHPPSGHAE